MRLPEQLVSMDVFESAVIAILAGVGFASLAGILFMTRDTLLKLYSIWSREDES